MEQAAFLALTLVGVGALVWGIVHTRFNWRPDAAPYGRNTRILDVLLHPRRYAREQAVPAIRVLNIVGVLSLAGGVGILMHKAYADLTPMFLR
jgi:hypothetical protein